MKRAAFFIFVWLTGMLAGCSSGTGLPRYAAAQAVPEESLTVKGTQPGKIPLDHEARLPQPVPTSGALGQVAERYRYKGPVCDMTVETDRSKDSLDQVASYYGQKLDSPWNKQELPAKLVWWSQGSLTWSPLSPEQVEITDARQAGGLVVVVSNQGETLIRRVRVSPAGEQQ